MQVNQPQTDVVPAYRSEKSRITLLGIDKFDTIIGGFPGVRPAILSKSDRHGQRIKIQRALPIRTPDTFFYFFFGRLRPFDYRTSFAVWRLDKTEINVDALPQRS